MTKVSSAVVFKTTILLAILYQVLRIKGFNLKKKFKTGKPRTMVFKFRCAS